MIRFDAQAAVATPRPRRWLAGSAMALPSAVVFAIVRPWLDGLVLPGRGPGLRRIRRWPVRVWLLCGCLGAAVITLLAVECAWSSYSFGLPLEPIDVLRAGGIAAALEVVSLLDGALFEWDDLGLAAAIVLPLVFSPMTPTADKSVAARDSLRTDSCGDADRAILAPSHPVLLGAAPLMNASHEPGNVFVFGDHRLLLFSGSRHASPMRGGAITLLPQELWHALPGRLVNTLPRVLRLRRHVATTIERRAPKSSRLLRANVHVRAVDEGAGRSCMRISAAFSPSDLPSHSRPRGPP